MPTDLLFVNAAQVVTCAGPGRARRGTEMRDAGVLADVLPLALPAVGLLGGVLGVVA